MPDQVSPDKLVRAVLNCTLVRCLEGSSLLLRYVKLVSNNQKIWNDKPVTLVLRVQGGTKGRPPTRTVGGLKLLQAYQQHLREGERVGVRDREQRGPRVQGREPARGSAVKLQLRRPAVANDFNVAPQHVL